MSTLVAIGGPLTGTALTGTFLTTNDVVRIPILGAQWASAKFSVGTAGTATATAEISVDGGFNFIASAYAKRLSTVSANPTVQAISATTLVTGDVWEVQLPSNATHFQVRCGGTGTVTTVTLSGSQVYASGMPVTAILYDATVTGGGNNNTGTLDGSGWAAVGWDIVVATAATGVCNEQSVDDAAAAIVLATAASLATGTFAGGLGVGVSMGTGLTPITGLTQTPLPKRFGFSLTGATTSSIRLRVEARR